MLSNALSHWLKNATRRTRRRTGPSDSARRRSFVPGLLALEGRTVPTTFVVSNLHDAGPGSLRQAVLDANAKPGPDVIRFADGLGGTITLTSGPLHVADGLTVNGPGQNVLTVSGNDASRVFEIGSGVTAAISRLTLSHGLAAQGGGIDNAGNLTISAATISANRAVGGMGGGGIFNEPGAGLTLSHSLLADNTATAGAALDVFGGGLLNEGTANVASCSFSRNQALGGAGATFFGGSVGGGIDNFGGATLAVSDSTFNKNQAISAAGLFFGIGGAIESNAGFDAAQPSVATITGCTFTDNLASGGAGAIANGGAIGNEGTGTSMTLSRSTLAGNQAVGGAGGDGVNTFSQGIGGGIINYFEATLTVSKCAFLGNKGVGGSGGSNVAAGSSEGVGGGGGILNAGATATVTDSTFIGNQGIGGVSADGPGGIGQGGAIENTFKGTLTVSHSTFLANAARGGKGATGFAGGLGAGGAIDTYSGTGSASSVTQATVTGSVFLGNQALGGVGGAGAIGGGAIGGAIAVGQDVLFDAPDSPTLTLGGDTFGLNLAAGGSGGTGGTGGAAWGGAVGVVSGNAAVSGSTFTGNVALGGTGGAGGNGGDGLGGGLFANAGATLTLSRSTITYNLAQGGDGGTGGSDGAGIGGGVYSLGVVIVDSFTMIAHNHASTSNNDRFGL